MSASLFPFCNIFLVSENWISSPLSLPFLPVYSSRASPSPHPQRSRHVAGGPQAWAQAPWHDGRLQTPRRTPARVLREDSKTFPFIVYSAAWGRVAYLSFQLAIFYERRKHLEVEVKANIRARMNDISVMIGRKEPADGRLANDVYYATMYDMKSNLALHSLRWVIAICSLRLVLHLQNIWKINLQ